MSEKNINQIFKFLSTPIKRKIIMHLYTCECDDCSVYSLCDFTKAKQANISKHLIDLRKAKIVYFKKKLKKSRYYLNPDFLNNYQEIILFLKKTNKDNICNC